VGDFEFGGVGGFEQFGDARIDGLAFMRDTGTGLEFASEDFVG
jgi:hypothetical protein